VFTFAKSTNKLDFVTFLEATRKKILNKRTKPWILLDNHGAHKSPTSKEIIGKYFKPLYIPSYSCQFNSIESLWGLFKKLFPSYVCDHVLEATTFESTQRLIQNMITDTPKLKI